MWLTDFNICYSIFCDQGGDAPGRKQPAGARPPPEVCLTGTALLKRGVTPKPSESPMIPRYTRPEMASIWEAQTRFKIWFEIEAHAADAQAELGVIPKEAAKTIWAKAKNASFDIARIDEIERETKHDVIAFTTHLAEIVGPDCHYRPVARPDLSRERWLYCLRRRQDSASRIPHRIAAEAIA